MKKILQTVFVVLVGFSSFGGNILWNGVGVKNSGTGGAIFNDGANWIGGVVPGPADQAIMTLNDGGNVSFNSSVTVGALLITTSGNNKYNFTLEVKGFAFIINGITSVDASGKNSTIILNVGDLGILKYNGEATFGASGRFASCFFAYGKNGTTGNVIFNGDLTINSGAITTTSTNLPAKILFDGLSPQMITDNSDFINFMPILQIGMFNFPIVTLSNQSTNFSGIQPNDIIINGTLIIPIFDTSNNYVINRNTPGGSLLLNAGGSLRLAGTAGGLTGSNFPANYTTVTLDSTSTVEFNGTDQTIPLPTSATVYGNLTLSGSGIKSAGGNILINRALDIGKGVTMALGNDSVTLKSNAQTTAFVKPVNGSITYGAGRFVVERFLSKTVSWRLLATPITSTLSPTINATWREGEAIGINTKKVYGTRITGPTGLDEYTQRASMKYFNMANNTYVDVNAASLALPIQKDQGYYVFVRGDRSVAVGGVGETTLKISGQLRTGNQTFSVIKNLAPASGFQSVGNPYASRIDVRNFILFSGGVSESFYIWNPKGGFYGVGQFESYVKEIAAPYNFRRNGSSAGAILNTIESGQAVFLQNASTTTDGSITIKENDKIIGSSLVSRAGVTTPTLEINLLSNDTSNQVLLDGVALNFAANFSNGIDNYDVRKIINTNDNLSLKLGTSNLSVERRGILTVADTLHLNIEGMRVAAYKLQIDPSVLGNLALNAFLVDKFLATETPLSLIAVTTVPFSITNETASRVADRFMIVFKQVVAAPLPFGFASVSANKNTDKTNTVKWTGANEINMSNYIIERSATVGGFASIGTTVATGNTGNSASYTFVDAVPFIGVNYYHIKATARDGQVLYSGIVNVVNNDSKPLFTVQPNPVIDKTLNLHFDNIQGCYTIKLVSKQGAKVFSKKVTIATESEVKKFSVGNVAAGVYEVLLVDAKEKKLAQTIFIQ